MGEPAQNLSFNGAGGQHEGQGMLPSTEPWARGSFEAPQAQVDEAAALRMSTGFEQKLNSALVEIAHLNGRLAKVELETRQTSR